MNVIPGVGLVCSKDCLQIAHGRREKRLADLRAEPLGKMPDRLETADFEHWADKLAVHMLEALGKKGKAKLAKNNPAMMVPEWLALDLKERILRHIPAAYVSEIEYKGHARMFCGGEYMFRQPVPREVIEQAAQKAEILQKGGAHE